MDSVKQAKCIFLKQPNLDSAQSKFSLKTPRELKKLFNTAKDFFNGTQNRPIAKTMKTNNSQDGLVGVAYNNPLYKDKFQAGISIRVDNPLNKNN